MSKVTITNLDDLSLKTNLKTNYIGVSLISGFLLLVFLLGLLLLQGIEDKIRKDTAERLQNILETTAGSLNLWVDQKIHDALFIASEKEVIDNVKDLLTMKRERDRIFASRELSEFRNIFSQKMLSSGDLGFFVSTSDSIIIASTIDENIGIRNYLYEKRSEFLNLCFSGNTVFIPAVESDIPLTDPSGVITSNFSTAFIAVPVKEGSNVLAILFTRVNLTDNLNRVLTASIYGDTGETYALDERGRLINRSRFESILRESGLSNLGTVTRTTFEIRDPGVNLIEKKKPVVPRYLQEFTLLAKNIMNKQTGFDVEGYSGYRGTTVLGAWKWIDRIGLGLATEIDEDEAMELYSRIRLLTFIGLIVIVVFALALVFGMLWVRRKSFKVLQEINEKLEEVVRSRTNELAKVNSSLVDSWERFRKLTYHSHDLNVIMDVEGIIKFESSAAEKLLGTREGERIGKLFFDFIHPDDLKRVEAFFAELLEDPNKVNSIEYRYKRRDDSFVVFESFLQNFIDDPNIEGIILNSRDVTDRRLAEESVKKSEQRFRSIWENSRDGMRITDSDGLMLMVNHMFCDMVKRDESEITGELFSIIYKEELQQKFLNEYCRKFEGGEILGQYEEEVMLWDNSVVWLSFSSSYIYLDEDSRVLLSIIRDISKSKKNEMINQLIYKINNTVFESSNFDELLKNVHEVLSTIIKAENFFIATYNEGSDTITIPYMVDKNDEVKDIPIEKTFTGYVIKKGEPVLLKEKDSLRMIEKGEVNLIGKLAKVWMGIPLKVNDVLSGVLVIQDYENENALGKHELEIMKFVSDQVALVMERILVREALIKSENSLREANQTKDKFFSIIAHDLRNPFVTILGFSDILNEDYLDMSDQERLELIKEMRVTAQSTYGMLENLLNWSKSETGTLKINPRLIQVKNLIETVFSIVDGNAKYKQIELKDEIEPGIKVFADKGTIETVLRNLVTNSIKFTNNGGSVKVCAIDKNEYVEITVEDNGIGIPAGQINRLFDLRENTTTRGTANETGSGLGLVLCKEFVERNKGNIRVESEEGEGSKFIFTLPKM